MTDPRQFNADEYLDKARDYAQDNPEHAKSFIDKIEDFVDKVTGGKISNEVDAAGDWVEGQLGMPNNTNNPDAPVDGPSVPAEGDAGIGVPIDATGGAFDPDAPVNPDVPENPDAPVVPGDSDFPIDAPPVDDPLAPREPLEVPPADKGPLGDH